VNEAQARPHWARLGRELKRLREFAGLTQRDMAVALKISQTTVDRIEDGGPRGKPLAWPRVQEWARACSAAHPDLAQLREMTESALDEHTLFRNLMSEGLAAAQDDIRAEEAVARTMRNFNPWGVPGLFQTPEYARRVLMLSDYRRAGGIEAAVEARMRRQEILGDGKHRLDFVMTEAGLLWRPGPVPVLAVQLAHLAEAVTRPDVTFSVIPAGVLAHAIPSCGFVIHEDLDSGEDPWVAVELHHKRVTTGKPEDVEIYRAQYELLRRSAVTGDAARALIAAAAADLRS